MEKLFSHGQECESVAGDFEIQKEIDAEPDRHEGDPKPLPLPAFRFPKLMRCLDREGRQQNDANWTGHPTERAEHSSHPPPLVASGEERSEQERQEERFRVSDVQKI